MDGPGMGVTGNTGGVSPSPSGKGSAVAHVSEGAFFQGTRGTGFAGPLGAPPFQGG